MTTYVASSIAIRYARGQVWMVAGDRDNDGKFKSRVMIGDRPYIILAIVDSSLVWAMPLTTRIDSMWNKDEENDIVITNYAQRDSRIITKQLTSVDIRRFRTYMFTVSDDIMHDICVTVANRIGFAVSTAGHILP